MIATRSVTIYETTDGKEFATEREAVAHQAIVDADASITSFIANRGLENAAATRVRNMLEEFVAHNALC